MFGSQASLKSLMIVCRSLSSMLDAGVDVRRAFEVAADKTSDVRMKRQLEAASDEIRRGADVVTALSQSSGYFPKLLLDMVNIGEQTGTVPEVLRNLAEHYENRLRMRKDFLSAIFWPCLQFVMATLVIALMLVILSWIASLRGGEPLDILGFGLTGTSGAVTFLTIIYGTLFGLFVLYRVAQQSLKSKRTFDGFLLQLPAIGSCMQAFAVARFSWSFALTQEAGMSIKPSLEASLRATSNGAYIAATDQIWKDVKQGQHLGEALAASKLFPRDFLEMVQVAEHSGTVPEALHRMSPQIEDQARRSLSRLATLLGWGVWMTVAAFIIFFIFRFAMMYIGMIEQAGRGI